MRATVSAPIQQAEARGTPVEILRSNTAAQVRNSLRRVYGLGDDETEETSEFEASRSSYVEEGSIR